MLVQSLSNQWACTHLLSGFYPHRKIFLGPWALSPAWCIPSFLPFSLIFPPAYLFFRSFFLFPRCDARFFNRASYVAEWQNEVSWLFYIESFWSGLPETLSDPLPVWFTRNLKWSHRAKWFRSSGGKVSGGGVLVWSGLEKYHPRKKEYFWSISESCLTGVFK